MRLIVRITLLLLLVGASVVPAFSQDVDVRSLPGDAPGDKVPFQFSTFATREPGDSTSVLIPVPQGTAVTIETITVRTIGDPRSFPNVRILTALADVSPPVATSPLWARHTVALVRKGTNPLGNPVYEGTHTVRLHHRSNVAPRFELWNHATEGLVTFFVSVAGYVTSTTRISSSEPPAANGSPVRSAVTR